MTPAANAAERAYMALRADWDPKAVLVERRKAEARREAFIRQYVECGDESMLRRAREASWRA